MILPGGFSYGDYLRCGAIARFAPVMTELVAAAAGRAAGARHLQRLPDPLRGAPAARRADPQRRAALHQQGRAAPDRDRDTPWTSQYAAGQEITAVLKSGEGAYVAGPAMLAELAAGGRVVARYAGANPNGSAGDIAGICNAAGNVVGLMPHPEHAIDALTGPGADGLGFFTSVLRAAAGA